MFLFCCWIGGALGTVFPMTARAEVPRGRKPVSPLGIEVAPGQYVARGRRLAHTGLVEQRYPGFDATDHPQATIPTSEHALALHKRYYGSSMMEHDHAFFDDNLAKRALHATTIPHWISRCLTMHSDDYMCILMHHEESCFANTIHDPECHKLFDTLHRGTKAVKSNVTNAHRPPPPLKMGRTSRHNVTAYNISHFIQTFGPTYGMESWWQDFVDQYN